MHLLRLVLQVSCSAPSLSVHRRPTSLVISARSKLCPSSQPTQEPDCCHGPCFPGDGSPPPSPILSAVLYRVVYICKQSSGPCHVSLKDARSQTKSVAVSCSASSAATSPVLVGGFGYFLKAQTACLTGTNDNNFVGLPRCHIHRFNFECAWLDETSIPGFV